MKLSVIIVNYNVEYFLEQCLNSVYSGLKNIDAEVFVVDNNSIDGSVEMVRQKFPQVHLIANKVNLGFSGANNQAMRLAQGEYFLLLNPDTVVEEDTFEKVIEFMDEHPEAGGLGVKMIDGKGQFLPESKRGLPTPAVAFYKIFGLSKLFPHSKRFGRYHLSYLDKDEIHEIEILSGAFMWMRKSALDQVGLLDEDFFMYGEDIDLSYRIILGGYKNYYFPKTRIIHYKGESTKKSSVNYVFVFYNAMIIFAKKHFSQKHAKLFSFLINLAIYFRASLAILSRFIKKAALPLFDFTAILAGIYGITYGYETIQQMQFPQWLIGISLPVYTVVWVFTQVFSGGYDKPLKWGRILLGSSVGTALILMTYALLPKEYQFSRLIILLGGALSFIYYTLSRYFLHLIWPKIYYFNTQHNKRIVIVGEKEECERVKEIIENSIQGIENVSFVSATNEKPNESFLGSFSQLDQVVDIHQINEVVFCAKNVSSEQIISQMLNLTHKNVEYKISQPESAFIIGSNSIDTQGDLYLMDINQINKPSNVRNKRMLDFFVSMISLILSPLLIWFYKNKKQWYLNMLQLFIGNISLVGYEPIHHQTNLRLPQIKKGILKCTDAVKTDLNSEVISRMNLIYAKNQSLALDLKILSHNFKKLDRHLS